LALTLSCDFTVVVVLVLFSYSHFQAAATYSFHSQLQIRIKIFCSHGGQKLSYLSVLKMGMTISGVCQIYLDSPNTALLIGRAIFPGIEMFKMSNN